MAGAGAGAGGTATAEKNAWLKAVVGLDVAAAPAMAAGPAAPGGAIQAAGRAPGGGAAGHAGGTHAAGGHAKAHAHPKPDAKEAGAAKITYDSFYFLVMQLEALADPKNHTKTPAALQLSGDKIVGGVLHEVEQVVAKWRDPKTIPEAVRLWQSAEPKLGSFLAQAQMQLQVELKEIGAARKSIADIADFLSMMQVDQELDAAAAAKPTPELAFDLDVRELQKLEPGMKAWREAVRASGKLAPPAAVKLADLIDTYFSAPDAAQRLAAFKAKRAIPDTGALQDVVVLLSDTGAQAATGLAETFLNILKLGEQAGEKGAAEALKAFGKWEAGVKGVARLGRGFFGVVNVALGAKTLAEGFATGDWHKITAGVFGIAGGAVEIAEAAGLISAEASTSIGMGVVVVWGTIDAVLSAAELAHWFRQKQEQDAFLSLVADARKIVPMGKKMAAAVDKMMETDGATDALGSDNNERYQQIATATGEKLRVAINKLVDRHINGSSKNTVGGYPALLGPAMPVIRKGLTTMNTFKDVPMAVSEGFEQIVQGIKLLTVVEAASNDA